jgi:hypothetical protein
MPDLPAPHHSAVLNRYLGLPPVHPELEPPPPAHLIRTQHRKDVLRRRSAARARARRRPAAVEETSHG